MFDGIDDQLRDDQRDGNRVIRQQRDGLQAGVDGQRQVGTRESRLNQAKLLPHEFTQRHGLRKLTGLKPVDPDQRENMTVQRRESLIVGCARSAMVLDQAQQTLKVILDPMMDLADQRLSLFAQYRNLLVPSPDLATNFDPPREGDEKQGEGSGRTCKNEQPPHQIGLRARRQHGRPDPVVFVLVKTFHGFQVGVQCTLEIHGYRVR